MVARVQPSRAAARRLPPKQQGIQAFAKAVKAGDATRADGKGAVSQKKRKLDEAQLESQEQIVETVTSTRSSKIAKLNQPSTNSESTAPTLLRKPPRSSISDAPKSTNRNPTNNDAEEDLEIDELPECLDDIVGLNTSFLTALSLHYTHNSLSAPADLRELLPSTEKIWKKRKVTIEDMQRLLHVLGLDDERCATFRLCNYGLGKFCIEILDINGPKDSFGPPFSETHLNDKFTRNLERIWRRNGAKTYDEDQDETFLRSIPLAPIHNSTTSFTSLRTGRQRLLDLTAGTLKLKGGKQEIKQRGSKSAASKPTVTLDRRNGLLQRIQSKQLKQSKLGPAPSKEALLRRSAADRVHEAVGVLMLLRPSSYMDAELNSASPQKKPYQLDAIIQMIQDSMRNPVSKEELVACLEILTQPSVAGDWINITTISTRKYVVLRSGKNISPGEISLRVTELKAWQ
ncbi:hypothetical protein AJ80_03129 [Polytolypa hystricis UAMH7299]|uniref:DNA replication factor Cdt1 C-terminal domain-containing protein n=1 Tax=Polytolypa hystricis (strain UAMH7299) TaxID=1447883 RepID=A0A2B7YKH8_POLH7|nr:hypothetical protein AJ80_03129 [Polytolypa hystricis UAMH7299]